MRAASVAAGIATIPVVYLLGRRTIGVAAGITAAAITAAAPFMVYYSAEGRGYALMMLLVALSTLAMVIAAEERRTGWWVAYAALSCAAVYTHYTTVFALAAQFLWLLWAHPESRRAALLANIGAAVAFLPWVSGLLNDFDSPTTDILSGLSPFTAHDMRLYLEHWAIGDPLSRGTPLDDIPGTPALVLLAVALALGLLGVARRAFGGELPQPSRRLLLLIGIVLAVPVGEAVVGAIGNNLLNVRNLAAAWPAFALCLGALVVAAGPRLRYVAAASAVAAFGIASLQLLDDNHQKPDYNAAADFIESRSAPGDAVIDATGVFTPAPYTPLDVALDRYDGPHPTYRAGSTASPTDKAIAKAVAAARGGRVFVVHDLYLSADSAKARQLEGPNGPETPFPEPYRLVERRAYPGTIAVLVEEFAPRGRS
jgi:mannosyltransferase